MAQPEEPSTIHEPPATITIQLTRPARDSPDEWQLNHPYLVDHAPFGYLARILDRFEPLVHQCRNGAPLRDAAATVDLTADQLVSAIGYAHLHDYVDMHRDGSDLTVTGTGSAPTPRRVDPAVADHHDPHRLGRILPHVGDRPPTYTMFRVPPTRHEHWALDSRYSRGTWGQHLGPNATRLLRVVATELDDPDGELSIRAAAAALRVTPRRLHAELDQLHRHGLIDLDHHRGFIASSGLVRAPSPELLGANPAVAVSHRCLARHGHSITPTRGLDLGIPQIRGGIHYEE